MYFYSKRKQNEQLKKRLLRIAFVSVIPFISIIFLGYFGWEEITAFDYQLSSYLYNLHSPLLNIIMKGITHAGDLLVQTAITILVVILLFALRKWRTGLWYGLTVLVGAGFLNVTMKELYSRARPSQIEPLVEIGGYSFPSGHSMGSVIVYGGILFLIARFIRSKQIKFLISLVIPLLIISIGISRIYLGVHFPTDVLGGFSLGLAWILLSISLLGLKYTENELQIKNNVFIN